MLFALILSASIVPTLTVPSSPVTVVPSVSSVAVLKVIKLFVDIVLPVLSISAKIASFK